MISGIITSDIIKNCGHCQLLHKESLGHLNKLSENIFLFNLIGKDIHYCQFKSINCWNKSKVANLGLILKGDRYIEHTI